MSAPRGSRAIKLLLVASVALQACCAVRGFTGCYAARLRDTNAKNVAFKSGYPVVFSRDTQRNQWKKPIAQIVFGDSFHDAIKSFRVLKHELLCIVAAILLVPSEALTSAPMIEPK